MMMPQPTIVLYTELDNKCDQQSTIVVDCRPHLASLPLLPGAVNNRQTGVYFALADGWHSVVKFSKSRVWDKVPRGSLLIELMLRVPLDTKQVILGTLFSANLLASTEKKVKNQETQNTEPRLTQ